MWISPTKKGKPLPVSTILGNDIGKPLLVWWQAKPVQFEKVQRRLCPKVRSEGRLHQRIRAGSMKEAQSWKRCCTSTWSFEDCCLFVSWYCASECRKELKMNRSAYVDRGFNNPIWFCFRCRFAIISFCSHHRQSSIIHHNSTPLHITLINQMINHHHHHGIEHYGKHH